VYGRVGKSVISEKKKDPNGLTEALYGHEIYSYLEVIEFTAVKRDTKLYERGIFSVENGIFLSRESDLLAELPRSRIKLC